MLRRLRFHSPADGIKVQRYVHIQNILTPHILAELIASKTAAIQYLPYPDFRNYHIWVVFFGNPLDAFFNFIRDVGNHFSPYGRRDALYCRLVKLTSGDIVSSET